MNKSTIIATILVNSRIMPSINAAENAIRSVYDEAIVGKSFQHWNTNVDESTANRIIASIGKQSSVNINQAARLLDIN